MDKSIKAGQEAMEKTSKTVAKAAREAAQAMARLQQEGLIALDAMAPHLIAPEDVERVTLALTALREAAA